MAELSLQTLLDRRAGFLAFVRRRVSDTELAEDILQTAYMRAVEKPGALRDGESVVAWFYSVLRNAVVDHYRRKATEHKAMKTWGAEHGLTGPKAVEPASPEASALDALTRTFVCGCIQELLPGMRPAYAEVLREVDLGEEPLAEFARRHELTVGNAAVRAHRARAALRAALAKFCGACSMHGCLDCTCKIMRASGDAA